MARTKVFIKIYLWFWLVTIFMMATIVAVDRVTESRPWLGHIKRNLDVTLELYGQSSMEVLAAKGWSELRDFVTRMDESTGTNSVIMDMDAGRLISRNQPGNLLALMEKAGKSGTTEYWLEWPLMQAARPFKSPAGGNYIIAIDIRPSPPPDRPGPPFFGPPPFSFLKLSTVLMLTGLLSYWLTRYLTRPIIKVGEAVRQLARGDLSTRVGPSVGRRQDEMAELAHDFDRMAERLEALVMSQRNLLRDVSHELRSPLARLNVALELCRRRCQPGDERDLKRIGREADRLNELIEGLLLVNRAESGASVSGLDKKPVELDKLVRSIADDAGFEAGGLNRGVSVKTLETCRVEGNPELLHRAVENVVRNAVHYSPEGGEVEISLHCPGSGAERRAVILVRDHGEGVPEEAVTRLFRPFYRVDANRDRQTGGAGLGLAITEAAVRLHGGSVRAANAEDGGLMVEILLPLK